MDERTFPPGFLFGAATAGHQVEGDNNTSDTWFAEQVTPTVFKEPSGKACNSYELWREDVDLAHGLGLTAYRFSVEWARVEPAEGRFDDEALGHYGAILDRCLALGLSTMACTRSTARPSCGQPSPAPGSTPPSSGRTPSLPEDPDAPRPERPLSCVPWRTTRSGP